jgi:hypothetical protein
MQIRWPAGEISTWSAIAPNRILHITEGVAEVAARPFVLK